MDWTGKVYKPDILVSKHMHCREPGYNPIQQESIIDTGGSMWYFTWILGVLLACAFGIINVMWMESEEMLGKDAD